MGKCQLLLNGVIRMYYGGDRDRQYYIVSKHSAIKGETIALGLMAGLGYHHLKIPILQNNENLMR
jgi:hypothetical protein